MLHPRVTRDRDPRVTRDRDPRVTRDRDPRVTRYIGNSGSYRLARLQTPLEFELAVVHPFPSFVHLDAGLAGRKYR
jgi:hypothetical protein